MVFWLLFQIFCIAQRFSKCAIEVIKQYFPSKMYQFLISRILLFEQIKNIANYDEIWKTKLIKDELTQRTSADIKALAKIEQAVRM